MTAKEASKIIGQHATYRTGSLFFRVEVTDIKVAYGRIRYQITPLRGTGESWVESNSIVIDAVSDGVA